MTALLARSLLPVAQCRQSERSDTAYQTSQSAPIYTAALTLAREAAITGAGYRACYATCWLSSVALCRCLCSTTHSHASCPSATFAFESFQLLQNDQDAAAQQPDNVLPDTTVLAPSSSASKTRQYHAGAIIPANDSTQLPEAPNTGTNFNEVSTQNMLLNNIVPNLQSIGFVSYIEPAAAGDATSRPNTFVSNILIVTE
ncbi:hypothetical protein Slin15195_G122660 [Septoria linicola]|uniref:Uncharacterized protein n=1 Tax=Septoria linicola TaxID=215465 RepID=A0A9Q9B7X4_9PEZI|nr:hypothetical protein Slin14017_G078860 [Septoria linicola]USW58947.1 hypothetical protein Slin15195_G122660 [Septoria linicola]